MKYSFHPAARQEFNEAVDYYEDCYPELGHRFTDEIYSTIHRIIEFPYAWAQLSKNTRRCLTNRFPYGVIYQIKDDEIIVIAVSQLNRRPNYWIDRVS